MRISRRKSNDTILKTLRADGSVLLPVDTAGRALGIVLILEKYWGQQHLSFPIYFLTNVATSTIDYVKSFLEWMNDSIGKSFEHTRENPFQLKTLDKMISNLEMELAAAMAAQESILIGSPLSENEANSETSVRRKYFMVVGINTAFSSRKRRDSVRATWMPQGDRRKKLEEEKGIITCFVIGHSATSGGILDKTITAEDGKHRDF